MVKKASAVQTRTVVYPHVYMEVCTDDKDRVARGQRHAPALTVERMKKLLGWEEVADDAKDYTLVDLNGRKVMCRNNARNRPFTESWCTTLAQEVLNRRWRLNLENIIISTTGLVQSGQHRLIGGVLAEQMRTGKNADHWEDAWKGPVTIETVIAFGGSENPEVTRTLDNVRPRSLSDVLFSDGEVFGKLVHRDRQALCKMVEKAVKFVWARTGMGQDGFSVKMTHSEALDFLDHHRRLLKAVQHIWSENKSTDGVAPIGRFLHPGFAAGFLYLMACSRSDGDSYWTASPRTERRLDFSAWDQACNFWVLLGKGDDFEDVRQTIISVVNGGGGREGTFAVIAKAWVAFAANDGKTPPMAKDLYLQYAPDKNGIDVLSENCVVDGIDLGEKKYQVRSDESRRDRDPTPEEIAAQAEKIKREALEREQEESRQVSRRRQEKKEARSREIAKGPIADEPTLPRRKKAPNNRLGGLGTAGAVSGPTDGATIGNEPTLPEVPSEDRGSSLLDEVNGLTPTDTTGYDLEVGR